MTTRSEDVISIKFDGERTKNNVQQRYLLVFYLFKFVKQLSYLTTILNRQQFQIPWRRTPSSSMCQPTSLSQSSIGCLPK